MTPQQRLESLHITLPELSAPVANYAPYVISDRQVFISGMLPMRDGAAQGIGQVGDNITAEQAKDIARLCGINILAALNHACQGDLGRVTQCVRLGIFINATVEFTQHPSVANGVSDLMVDVFGSDIGAHARFAVGVSGLPLGVAVEADALFTIA